MEGLALGKMTICSLDDKVINVIKNTTGSNSIPFENIWINELEKKLIEIINLGPNYINQIGINNRKWMEKYCTYRIMIRTHFSII